MVTVSDPSGTPSPVYNRSGTTIANLTANGSTQAAATAIARVAGWTVVLATIPDINNQALKMPSDAEVGDLVELHRAAQGTSYILFPESGGKLYADGTANAGISGIAKNTLWRRIASGVWSEVYGND